MSILLQTISAVFGRVQRARSRAFKQLQRGKLAAAVLTCDTVLRRAPDDQVAQQILKDVAGRVTVAVQNFRNASDASAEAVLREIRFDFATMLQALPAKFVLEIEGTQIAQALDLLTDSGLRDLPRSSQEKKLFDSLHRRLAADNFPVEVPTLRAAMLLGFSFELPLPTSLELIPAAFRERYCQFLFETPQVLRQLGDADRCAEFVANLIDLFHKESLAGQITLRTTMAKRFAEIAATRANYLQPYFTNRNLRPMMAQRGDLMAVALISAGAVVLHALPPRRYQLEKIRLGIFTPSFGPFTDSHFTASHLDHLERDRFDITLYVFKATGDALERHCLSRADRLVVLPREGLKEQSERIREDDLDILMVGVNQTITATAAALLGCLRLARTQVATVSSPVTTGLHHMDVMLSAVDNEVHPGAQKHYSEQLWLMNGSVNVYAYQYDTEPATVKFDRSHLQVSAETTVFFSGANFFKIIPELSLAWANILARVPDSVLVLMPFNPNWTDSYRAAPFINRIKEQFRDCGVAPERLRLIDPVPARADVHRVIAACDIYLDAYPFAGACSMLDPIIVSVPPVVRSGTVGRSLHGAAIMRMTGIDDVICTSEESYISTAVDLATNPARRVRMIAALKAVNARQPPPYFDTFNFSSNVSRALMDIHRDYLAPYEQLGSSTAHERRNTIQELANAVVARSTELASLSDIDMIQVLIRPYFSQTTVERRRHMVDVGACYGALAVPLLEAGWTADLFEPDPRTRETLTQQVGRFGTRCRVFNMAVTNSDSREIAFHQTRAGLSGLGASPFGATESVLKVPATTLAGFYAEHGVKHVDFLKIDAEGFDFDVLASHDFKVMRPAVVMVEYGTHFENQPLHVINQSISRMTVEGYGSVVFNYFDDGNFSQGNFVYQLTHVLLDRPLPDVGRVAFGNILFYQADDMHFLLSLYALLDVCRPRASTRKHAVA